MKGGDRRFTALMDSRVAKRAIAKGRSAARALRPTLLRACSCDIAGNLHHSLGFAPTRLNTADAPTREKPLSMQWRCSILDFCSLGQPVTIHSHQFSRAAAGWIRLYILVAFCLCPGEGCWISIAALDFVLPLPWICLATPCHTPRSRGLSPWDPGIWLFLISGYNRG